MDAFDGGGDGAMHVPLGMVSLVAGVLGALIFIVGKFNGKDSDFTLLAASLAAFVAGWIATVSIPQLDRRIRDLRPSSGSNPERDVPDHAANPYSGRGSPP
jgi:hypothetical protein